MAGESERLELIASVRNLTSGPLKDIQRSMRALAADTKIGHQQGITFAKDHALALSSLRRTVVEAGTATRGILAPALATLGISGLGAASGIVAVVAAVKGFSDSARSLTFLARESGLAINTLKVFQDLAPKIGASAESMSQGLANFGDHMMRLGRSGQGFILELNRINQAAIGLEINPRTMGIDALAISLQKLPREQQLEKVLDFALRFKDIDVRKKIFQVFDVPKEFANVTNRKELHDLIEQQKKITRPLAADEAAGGKKTADAVDDITTRAKNLRDMLATSLIPQLDAFTKQMQILGDSELGKGLRGFAGGIDAVVSATTGWLPILELYAGFRALKFFRLAAGLRSVGAGLGEIAAAPAPAPWLLSLLGVGGSAAAGVVGTGAALAEIARRLSNEGNPEDPNNPDFRDPMTGARLRSPAFQFRGNAGDKDEPGAAQIQRERIMPPEGTGSRERPLWRKLWDMTDKGGGGSVMPASYSVVGGGANPLLAGAGGDSRGLEGIIEHGTLAALRDFAAEQKALAGGGGGGGGGAAGGMAAIRANYSPGGGGGLGGAGAGTGEPSVRGGAGGGGAAQPAGEPSTDGGAGTGQRPSSDPMGSLGGKPVGVTSIGGGGAPGAMKLMRDLHSRGWSPEAAATAAGNVAAESNFKTGTVGDHGTSFGLAQWHGDRARKLMGEAKAQGKDWKDWGFQVDHLDKEWRQKFGDKSVASHDFGALSKMGKKFEGYSTNTFGARVAGAQRYLKQFNAGGGEPGKAPHFDVADIRKSVEGSPGGPGAAAGPWRDQTGHHYYEHGSVSLGDQNYHWGSGGAGAGALPFGSYPINIGKGDIGPIGQRIGSVATLGNLGGEFTGGGHHWAGVQMHRAFSDRLDHLYTQGCFSIAASEWPAYKQKLLEENAKTPGGLQLNVGPNGMASITARGNPNQNLVPAHAADPKSPKRADAINLRRPHSTAGGVKSGILPFGESPNVQELRKLHGEMPNIGAALGGTENQDARRHKDSLSVLKKEEWQKQVGETLKEHNDFGGGRFGGIAVPKHERNSLDDYTRGIERGLGPPRPEGGAFTRPEQKANYDLLSHAREAGFVGQPMQHRVEGHAHLQVDVNGPAGTQARMKRMDGMFREARINRGRSMPRASESA